MRLATNIRSKSALAATSFALLVTAAWPGAAAAAHATTSPTADITADADWLLQGQLPDGAIAWYVDKRHISPYLANYAAIGLAEARKKTGTVRYSDAAWAWLSWYAAHRDANGFVTDYEVDAAGVETSTGDEDSTDAYAGTFLSAVRATNMVAADSVKLGVLHPAVAAAVAAIEATQDADGLTWAKPAWHLKYLMDQTEAYSGLLSAAEVAGVFGDLALERRATADAARMKQGIHQLWDEPTAAYDWAENDTGGRTSTDWTVLYSDAMEQAWAAGSDAVPQGRAKRLMDELAQAQPNWSSPNSSADINGTTASAGYWPVAGWALLRVKQDAQAAAAGGSIRTAAIDNGRAWPFTTGNAGQLIVLESGDTALFTP